jgi:uncharacterized protein with von Willebrand factor type A (vWA) domain
MNFAANVLRFGRLLRDAGFDVHHGRLLDAVRALELVNIGNRSDVAAAMRSLLVHDRDQIGTFDRAFALFFTGHGRSATPGAPLVSLGERPRVVAQPAPGVPVHTEVEAIHTGSAASTRAVGAWSALSVSRTKDFADFTERELEEARTLLERVPWSVDRRRTRRWQRATGGAPDLRRVLRRKVAAGDLIDLPRRARREARRPLVLLGDVSGSMERYSRVMVQFVYGLSRGAANVEVFLFATRLTRVTPQLAAKQGTAAVARVARAVQDWGGGTRIGEALRAFNTRWARRVIRNGPVVMIVSDGWDRGDPALLARELARVRRSCRRLIWLNPLLGSAQYEPLTRGMQAALAHVDDFLPAHNLVSLEQLAERLRALPPRTHAVSRSKPAAHAPRSWN